MEKSIASVRGQYRACFKRMAFEGVRWNLHRVNGTDQFTIFREDATLNGADLPVVIRNIHAMTEQTLINKLTQLIMG